MNISIENLAPCKQLIRVDVPEETVKQKMDVITGEFRKQANLPGFRAGKAPKHMVIKSYGDRIEQEVRKDLVNEGYRKAIKDNDLHTVGNPDVEEIQFGQDLPFQFAVTVETAPTFELPDYKGIKIQKEIRSVTEEDIDKAMGVLQDRQAKFDLEAIKQENENRRKAEDLAARERMNTSDNETAKLLAAAEMATGEKVAVSTGTGINPNPQP